MHRICADTTPFHINNLSIMDVGIYGGSGMNPPRITKENCSDTRSTALVR